MGRLTKDQAANIAREMRYLWRYLENLYPNGDRRSRAQLKVTIDTFGQYHFYLNQQAMRMILFYAHNIPDPNPIKRRGTEFPVCLPEVPDFLRWDESSSAG